MERRRKAEGVEDWARRRRVVIWMEGEGELFLRERRRGAAEDSTNRSVPPRGVEGALLEEMERRRRCRSE